MMRETIVLVLAAFGLGCNGGSGDATTNVTNEPGSFDAGLIGSGDSTTESFTWVNEASRAEYNMDITAANGGSVTVTLQDAAGADVAEFRLEAGVGDDTLDGVSMAGEPGSWTVRIALEDFAGNGTLTLDSVEADTGG